MNNTNYFYSDGTEKFGPFSFDDLKEKQLNKNTLIWFEGNDGWKPLVEIPNLYEQLNPTLTISPPPLPSQKSTDDEKKEQFRKSNRIRLLLIIWSVFHLFALIMSHTGIKIFNEGGNSGGHFWPFVDFYQGYYGYANDYDTSQRYIESFNGIFHRYDWLAFTFYVGFAWIIYFVVEYARSIRGDKVVSRTKSVQVNKPVRKDKSVRGGWWDAPLK